MPELDLREWERVDAARAPQLLGLSLDEPRLAADAARLRRAGALTISEDRHGLVVEAGQHVGVVNLGGLRVRIRPKVATRTLWALLAYGLGIDDLPPHPPVDIALEGSVPDLLAAMLVIEADRLWRSGLQRGYAAREEWLGSPRGRPDLAVLARHVPLTRAALPCRYQAFTADTLPNQVVLAGLRLALRLPGIGPRLRAALHLACQRWSTVCALVPLTPALFVAAERAHSRLTARYAPAHRLVAALAARSGPDEALGGGGVALQGALWNMATLFERAAARFLGEHLPSDLTVSAQHRMRRLYSVDAGDHGHGVPSPRPDLLVTRGSEPIAVLDTKYRDLSVTKLPREILYQLSVYSLAFGGPAPVPAIVLYAVPDGDRADVRFRLHVSGAADRVVVLRAAPLERLVRVSAAPEEARAEALRWVAVGPAVPSARGGGPARPPPSPRGFARPPPPGV